MATKTATKISREAASARFYRGQLLSSVLLSPSEFFNAIVPLYNCLNGEFTIRDIHVEYSESLFNQTTGEGADDER